MFRPVNESTGHGLNLESLTAYRDGYKMIRDVAVDFDPVRIVDETWTAKKRRSELMQAVADELPGLVLAGELDPRDLAIDLLAAVGDLLDSDPALKPILVRHLHERLASFERLLDEHLDEID
jgi:hypothetical protein